MSGFQITIDWILEKAKIISTKEIKKVASNLSSIFAKIKDHESFKNIISDVIPLGQMVKDYYDGKYKEVPIKSIGAIAFALLYVVAPIDLIPDFIPVIGYVDDVAVCTLVLKYVHADLVKYKEWKSGHPEETPTIIVPA